MSPHPSHRAPGQVLPPTPILSPRSADAPRPAPRPDPRGRGRGTGPSAGPGVWSRGSRSRAWRRTFFLMAVARRRPRLAQALPSRGCCYPRRQPRPGPPAPLQRGTVSPRRDAGTRKSKVVPPCHQCTARKFFQNFGRKNSHPSESVWHIIFEEPPPLYATSPKSFYTKTFPGLGGYADSTPVPT